MMLQSNNLIHLWFNLLALTQPEQEEYLKIANIEIPTKISFNDMTLVLNGAGIRTKFFMNAYLCGLYLKEPSTDADAIIYANQPMGFRIYILSSFITGDMMAQAIKEGFLKAMNGNISEINDQLDKLLQLFLQEPIRLSDRYDLMYLPEKGIQISKNDSIRAYAEGLDFKQAVCKVWLGKHPVQKELKKRLLG
ncbi:MAG: chalcone isomerase family protein [Desulfobacterales bacterium]|nr:chalcone isomerase family protein [Desulfobacterales bacterium]